MAVPAIKLNVSSSSPKDVTILPINDASVGKASKAGLRDMSAKTRSTKQPEFSPHAWERFERAVDIVAKSPPQHRTKTKKNPKKIKTAQKKAK